DAGGGRRQVAERRQRIPVPRARELHGIEGDGDVFTAGEVVVAQSVGGLGDAPHVIDGAVLLPRREHTRYEGQHGCEEAELHPSIVMPPSTTTVCPVM